MNRLPTLEDLSPFKELLYESLNSAILATSEHFKVSNHHHEQPGFFANHVRSKLYDILLPEANSYNFSIDQSSGSFLVYYKEFVIKLYKAYQGMIPLPGKENRARLLFLNHNSSLFSNLSLPGFEALDGPFSGNRVHLIAYYDITIKYGSSKIDCVLAWLRIACPQMVAHSGIDCFWDEAVVDLLSASNVSAQGQSTAKREDLTFTLHEDDLAEDDDSSEIG